VGIGPVLVIFDWRPEARCSYEPVTREILWTSWEPVEPVAREILWISWEPVARVGALPSTDAARPEIRWESLDWLGRPGSATARS
jgi:hypothetical protein